MLNPYAFAKYTGEQTCEMYNKVYDLSVVTARFFNVYGDRQPTSGTYATVVGVFEGLKKQGKPLTITGTGEQRRDFTHVHCAEIYQLGTGKNYSINELASLFDSEVVYIPPRPGEALITKANNSSAIEKLNWKPKQDLKNYVKRWLLEQ